MLSTIKSRKIEFVNMHVQHMPKTENGEKIIKFDFFTQKIGVKEIKIYLSCPFFNL